MGRMKGPSYRDARYRLHQLLGINPWITANPAKGVVTVNAPPHQKNEV